MSKFPLKQKNKTQGGFTIVELGITIVILGIIVSLAIPSYYRVIEESRSNEAKVNLNTIYMGEKIYFLNHNGVYWVPGDNPPVDGAGSINTTLNIDIRPQFYTIDSIAIGTTGSATTSFLATASRSSVAGGAVGATPHAIDQTGTYQ